MRTRPRRKRFSFYRTTHGIFGHGPMLETIVRRAAQFGEYSRLTCPTSASSSGRENVILNVLGAESALWPS